MLIYNFQAIGNTIYIIRKKAGLTQEEVAERADISPRSYADFERGTVNMRLENILRICDALSITPDTILTDDNTSFTMRKEEILRRLAQCSQHEQETALRLLDVYFQSLE